MTNDDLSQLTYGMAEPLKYAHLEKERRFLLRKSVVHASNERSREIRDRYLIGTRLRLRSVEEAGVPTIFKLGQKIRLGEESSRAIAHTSIYLSPEEFALLTKIPANELIKVRWSKKIGELTLSIDEFAGLLTGLILVEVDSEVIGTLSDPFPEYLSDEVTDDERFTGGALATTTAEELRDILATFSIIL